MEYDMMGMGNVNQQWRRRRNDDVKDEYVQRRYVDRL